MESKKSKQNQVEENSDQKTAEKKRLSRLLQTNVPLCSVDEALIVPQALWDHLAGKPSSPLQVCKALDLSPSSSKWRDLSGAAIAYGLTLGGCNAKEISLEPLGKRAVAPIEEGDDIIAVQQAVMTPTILKQFFDYYQNKKFPKDSIAENMLIEWGVPKDRAHDVVELIKQNGIFARLFSDIKGSQYVMPQTGPLNFSENELENGDEFEEDSLPKELLQRLDLVAPSSIKEIKTNLRANNKVFISHGKNRKMVDNLKELLIFGTFEPIVSVEREASAISVPEKVFSDMRDCCAGIIHIEEEKILIDEAGNTHKVLNENVLIEIGAAIALYGKKIILLCQKGITLPSNLQGLYRCEYEGDKLDYDATMKLLKTFNSFKSI